MLKLSLRDYSDAYILVKGTVTIPNTRTVAAPNNKIKKVLFRNCAPFTGCISKAQNEKVDDSKDIDVVMPMYNLIEFSDNYSKISGRI